MCGAALQSPRLLSSEEDVLPSVELIADHISLWQEHGYQNGRVVFVSCKTSSCQETEGNES